MHCPLSHDVFHNRDQARTHIQDLWRIFSFNGGAVNHFPSSALFPNRSLAVIFIGIINQGVCRCVAAAVVYFNRRTCQTVTSEWSTAEEGQQLPRAAVLFEQEPKGIPVDTINSRRVMDEDNAIPWYRFLRSLSLQGIFITACNGRETIWGWSGSQLTNRRRKAFK